MTTHITPQELGRTSQPPARRPAVLSGHGHADHDLEHFCLDCFKDDLDHDDIRGELALLATIDLKRLADLRSEADGVSIREAWRSILDVERLKAELASSDPRRRDAASHLRDTITDFLNYRIIVAHPEAHSVELALEQEAIAQRTRERLDTMDATGSEPYFFQPIS